MRWLQVLAVVVAFALSVTGCRSLTGRSFGQQWDDKTVTAHVKTKLAAEKFGNLFSTDVGTQYGVVYLGGNVNTEEQKAEAERIASRVAGVKRVQNNLIVVPRDQKETSASSPPPSASPPSAQPLAVTGQVTAIDRASGDVTLKTPSGDMIVRLPVPTLRNLEQGQRLSINAGQP
jgi:hypothetical protein